MSSIYEIPLIDIHGQTTTLATWRGQVLLIVNVASKCGFTPQYAGLEALYQRYCERGFAVLGFPCNQFGSQEPGDAAEIMNFCSLNYQVSFPMFARINVNGAKAHPLYLHMKKAKPGILGSKTIKWNFTKFLLDREGHVVSRFAPTVTPDDLDAEVLRLL